MEIKARAITLFFTNDVHKQSPNLLLIIDFRPMELFLLDIMCVSFLSFRSRTNPFGRCLLPTGTVSMIYHLSSGKIPGIKKYEYLHRSGSMTQHCKFVVYFEALWINIFTVITKCKL